MENQFEERGEKMNITLSEWLQAADHEVELRKWRDTSEPGKFKTCTQVHHINNCTPEQFAWYFKNFNTDTYRLWHPAHKAIMWENKTDKPGAIHVAWESINGKMAAYRVLIDAPLERSPIPIDDPTDVSMNEFLDTDGNPVFWTHDKRYMDGDEMVIISTFIFPEKTPDSFVEAHAKHNLEEIPGLVNNALPVLLKRAFGYMPDDETLKKYPGVIIPADRTEIDY